MKRGRFIQFMVPAMWALQACVKEEASKPTTQPIKVAIQFPLATDFCIGGVLNPVRFSITPRQPVAVQLFDEAGINLIAETIGIDEVWLQIPKVNLDTLFQLKIANQLFAITVKNVIGEAVSIRQYETQFSQAKTVAILTTNDIPFAVKRETPETYTAFDMTCTHSGCRTDLVNEKTFECFCHGSKFDANGNVTNGPALDKLRRFPVQVFPIHQVLVVNNK